VAEYGITVWGVVLFFVCSFFSSPAVAKEYTGVLREPVVLGAWLYGSKCARCHQEYGVNRVAGEYDDIDELAQAFGDGRCRIAWSRRAGGPLNKTELQALAQYMLKWEEDGGEPELPELPPPDLEKPEPQTPVQPIVTAVLPVEKKSQDDLPSALQNLIEKNPVAHGGWLYTNNCYRCHLNYEKARVAKAMSPENLKRIVSEGKTSTQMKPFSRILGGNLKTSEIADIAAYIAAWEYRGANLAIAQQLMRPPDLDPADFEPVRLTRFKRIEGDSSLGKSLFLTHCSSCHGATGEGLIGKPIDRLQSMRPDLYLKSVIKQGIPGSLMKTWEKDRGGRFSAKDIEDVVYFVTQIQKD